MTSLSVASHNVGEDNSYKSISYKPSPLYNSYYTPHGVTKINKIQKNGTPAPERLRGYISIHTRGR